MPEVLYRKYRPQTFSAVKGQHHIKLTLQNEILMGRVGHAYVFFGARGVAKTTMARLLAKAINCEARSPDQSEPCNQCRSCKEIVQGRSLDVLEIDAASHTGVDNVRENIIENSRFQPIRSAFKVYIIDEVHMLSISAFNALLKILEEPPSYVMFILVTTEVHKIPQTILSRCQRFDFRRIGRSEILESLQEIAMQEKRTVDKDVLLAIVRHSDGCLRDALSLLDQVLALSEQQVTMNELSLLLPVSGFAEVLELAEHLMTHATERALSLIQQLSEEGTDVIYVFDTLIDLLRRCMVSKVTGNFDELLWDVSEEDYKKIAGIIQQTTLDDLLACMDILLKRRTMMKTTTLVALPMEMAIVEICAKSHAGTLGKRDLPRDHLTSSTKKDEEMMERKASASESMSITAVLEDTGSDKGDESKEAKKTSNLESQEKEELPCAATGIFPLRRVQEEWGKLIQALQQEYHSLALLLQLGRPLAMQGNTVTIGFQFQLHQRLMNEAKNRLVLCEKFSEVLHAPVAIECVVSDEVKISLMPLEDMVSAEVGGESLFQQEEPHSESVSASLEEKDPLVASVLKEFGGELVK